MLKQPGLGRWVILSSAPMLPVFLNSKCTSLRSDFSTNNFTVDEALKFSNYGSIRCGARRRVRYEDEDEDEEDYGHNEEIAMLELYTEYARGEALLVQAVLDEHDVEVLIFKGFSSSLSHGTYPDPSKSVIPSRAVIKSIDRIKGPFDPSNIQYIEKDLKWESFKTRFASPNTRRDWNV